HSSLADGGHRGDVLNQLLSRLWRERFDEPRPRQGSDVIGRHLISLFVVPKRLVEAGQATLEARSHEIRLDLPSLAPATLPRAPPRCQPLLNLPAAAELEPRGRTGLPEPLRAKYPGEARHHLPQRLRPYDHGRLRVSEFRASIQPDIRASNG